MSEQAETQKRQEMEAALEAVLFVSPDPVSRQRLLELFAERDREVADAALATVIERYAPEGVDGRGVMIEEVAGGVRLITRPEMNDWLRKFFESGASRKLSMGALETLAIIAYRQPVTSPEIQELRSVSPAGVLKTLLERRLIRIAGRKEVVGKPFLYATTQEFLLHFGLKNLKDLPPLEEFEEALAGEGLGELLGGSDLEEEAMREAAELEELEEDRRLRAEAESEDEPHPEEPQPEEPQPEEPQPEEGIEEPPSEEPPSEEPPVDATDHQPEIEEPDNEESSSDELEAETDRAPWRKAQEVTADE